MVAFGLLPMLFLYWPSRILTPVDGGVDLSVIYLGLSAIFGCLVLVGLWFALGRKVTMIVGPDTLTLGQMWGGRQTVLGWDEIAGIEAAIFVVKTADLPHFAVMLTDDAAHRLRRPVRKSGAFRADFRYNGPHLSIGVHDLADIVVTRAAEAGRIVTGPEIPYGGAIHDHKRWMITEAPPEGA